jgi:hypothetical protein
VNTQAAEHLAIFGRLVLRLGRRHMSCEGLEEAPWLREMIAELALLKMRFMMY